MKVRISSSLLEQIKAFAEADSREICGLLLGETGCITEILPAANVATDPARYFELDPAVLLAAHKAARVGGPAIMGHYHSHPSGRAEPSATDLQNAVPDGSIWMILGGSEVALWIAGPGNGAGTCFTAAMLDIM